MQRDGTLDCNVRNEDSLAPPGTREWLRGRTAVDTYEVLLRILFWVMAESEDSVRERLSDAMELNGGSVISPSFSETKRWYIYTYVTRPYSNPLAAQLEAMLRITPRRSIAALRKDYTSQSALPVAISG